jgi:uncharacterized membrane protein
MIELASATRVLHVAAGAVSLLAGSVALATRKGSRPHRLAGKIFLVAMCTIAATALVLATVRPNPFLFFLAVFSGYLAVWGRVALARKPLAPHTPAPRSHYLPTLAFALFCVYFAVAAVRSGALVFQIFAALALLLVAGHLQRLRRGGEYRVHWLLDHLAGFSTAFIASITAFMVVNTPRFLPNTEWAALLVWLGPTLIGVPLLRRASNKLTAPERARKAAAS